MHLQTYGENKIVEPPVTSNTQFDVVINCRVSIKKNCYPNTPQFEGEYPP